MIKKILRKNETVLFLISILLIIILTSFNRSFLTLENFFDMIKINSGMAILSIGFLVVILSGGIDLSFTAIGIFCAFIATSVLVENNINNMFLAFGIACGMGIFLGAINAFFISYYKIPPLITTLATYAIYNGVLLVYADNRSFYASELPQWYNKFGKMSILTIIKPNGAQYGLSIFIVAVIVLILFTLFILKFTMLGKGIYAIGGNMESAKRSGFNIMKIHFFVYCFMGFLAAVAAMMETFTIQSVQLVGYSVADLTVIAAVILGGGRITGGYGTVLGTILGVVLLMILKSNLVLIGLSSFWNEFVIGFVIIIGVIITSIQVKRKSRGISIIRI